MNVTKNAFESSEVPTETNGAVISTAVTENSICDITSHLNGSDLQNIAVYTETTEDSISVAENQIIIPKKILNNYLYLMSRVGVIRISFLDFSHNQPNQRSNY